MNKILVSTNDFKKIEFCNNYTEKEKVLILFRKDKEILNKIKYEHYIFIEELKNTIKYLDILTKASDRCVIIYNCLRFNKFNGTQYNRIYQVCNASQNHIICTDFPFVFDYRNIYIPLKMLNVIEYHPKQWYDDSFYINNIQCNSIEFVNNTYNSYFLVDSQKLNYTIYTWEHTKEEQVAYEEKKHRSIYIKNYPKIKVMTSLQGFVNRMESKLQVLKEVVHDKNCLIFMNWEKGFQKIKDHIKGNFILQSYHTRQNIHKLIGLDTIIFYENIISQRIKFYDTLKKYGKYNLCFFVNDNIGVDKINSDITIKTLEELNVFYDKTWKSL